MIKCNACITKCNSSDNHSLSLIHISPFVTSGVRLGTPAVTTRGLKEDDMDMIAECIALVLQSEDNIEKVKGMVAELTAKYPLDM